MMVLSASWKLTEIFIRTGIEISGLRYICGPLYICNGPTHNMPDGSLRSQPASPRVSANLFGVTFDLPVYIKLGHITQASTGPMRGIFGTKANVI